MRKENQQKLVVIFLGPPGSGKGTQAWLLAEKLNLYYLETSKILEEKFQKIKSGREYIKVQGKKYYVMKEKELWEKGSLCSPPFVTSLIIKKIKELYKKNLSLVLAGSPRTLYEGRMVVPLLKRLYGKENIKIILLVVSPRESIFRNSHRRICELIRHPILYNKETKNLKHCPLDGSKLLKRKLDNPETIKIRLKEYRERTFPLIEYFQKEGIKVEEINAEQSVVEVFNDLLKKLKLIKRD